MKWHTEHTRPIIVTPTDAEWLEYAADIVAGGESPTRIKAAAQLRAIADRARRGDCRVKEA